jgi:Leucine-rich repeat (LRR) protein
MKEVLLCIALSLLHPNAQQPKHELFDRSSPVLDLSNRSLCDDNLEAIFDFIFQEESLEYRQQLTKINLRNNKLINFPSQILFLPNLKIIDLRNNPIRFNLADVLSERSSLKILCDPPLRTDEILRRFSDLLDPIDPTTDKES